ncbi:copper amine oxidase N-terminal domain-containing protein [Ammonifex thiophilus]|uniref:copper amine oxidase N-terminal domain-containing protein n=1 Tax=Ammonifex thiophilus TaxID=444093 RepID=UPI001401EF83|nr:copper amine oxidase N-terminal domain-containing protein [Ammonifex thiophilus]
MAKGKVFALATSLLAAVFLFPSLSWAAVRTVEFTIGSKTYWVDGKSFSMDTVPRIENGHLLVPVRFLAYALGVKESGVSWDPSTGEVRIEAPPGCYTCTYIQLWLYENFLLRNLPDPTAPDKVARAKMRLGTTPILDENGRVLVPVRGVAEAFGATVSWDPESQKATVKLNPIMALRFTRGGDKYIFSNQPEFLPDRGGYTIEQTLNAGERYGVEFFHIIPPGGKTKLVGVALYNPSSSSATVKITGKVSGKDRAEHAIDLTSEGLVDFFRGKGAGKLELPAGGYALLMVEKAPENFLAWGKAKLEVERGTLKLRVFHLDPSSLKEVSDQEIAAAAFKLPRDREMDPGVTTGLYGYDHLRNANPIEAAELPCFVLSEWLPRYNLGEYDRAAAGYLGYPYLGGNYGMVYEITISNPGGRKLRITPNWQADANNYARIVLYTPKEGWRALPGITRGQSWEIQMDDSPTFTFRYVLPGGNFGGVRFEVVSG